MMKSVFSRPEKFSMYYKETIRQMNDIGVGSLIIVGIISIFIGAVTAVQFAYQLSSSFVPMWYIGYIVRDIAIIEMAPTISCHFYNCNITDDVANVPHRHKGTR
ncbi:MAG: ABC transporter permease [Bacteroidota bacterium]